MNRQQLENHLTLHGWVPVNDPEDTHDYHLFKPGFGFAWGRMATTGFSVRYLGLDTDDGIHPIHPIHVWGPREQSWDWMPDEVLFMLAERMQQKGWI